MACLPPRLASQSQSLLPAYACLNFLDAPCENEEIDSTRSMITCDARLLLHHISIHQEPNPTLRRPMLYLFPRGDPEAPFVPLCTRHTFRTSTTPVKDCDSDSSSLYASTDEEDDEENPCAPVFKDSAKRSESPIIQTLQRQGILKNSKDPARPSIPSIQSSPASSLFASHVKSGPTVRIVEPLDVLEELHELRKTLTYDSEGSPTRPRQIAKPLPASPKLGFKKAVTIKSVVKAYQRTPPATSSIARIKWVSARGLALNSVDNSLSVKLRSDHTEPETLSTAT